MSEYFLDDPLQTCVYALINQYWIILEDQPELYTVASRNIEKLRDLFDRMFSFRLIFEAEYIKLVKTPSDAKTWMGISTFLYPQDYVFLACFIAYMEEKGEGQQFVLQDVCEAILNYYPGPAHEIIWTKRSNRQSLIRVIRFCEELKVVKTFDRRIDDFQNDKEHDMLFETTVFLRNFFNRYFFNFSEVGSFNDLRMFIQEEEERDQVQSTHRLMRRLFFEPCVLIETLPEAEKLLLANFSDQLRQNIDDEFDFLMLEEYPSMVMLTHSRHHFGQYYPAEIKSSTLSLMTTQFATFIWTQVQSGNIQPDEIGTIIIATEEAARIFSHVKRINDHGWSTTYQRETAAKVWSEAFAYMASFGFVKEENGYVYLYETLGRVIGDYEEGGVER